MFRRTPAETRILILAPMGRDAHLIAATLTGESLVPAMCSSPEELLSMLAEGAAAAIIAEEALPSTALTKIARWLATQPPWSDFPFVVLTSGGRSSPISDKKARDLKVLGNVTFLERPARPETVRSSLRAALRARLRQYEMRHRQETLAQVNADLEEFAHSASHDLREPIRNIAIYSEIIEQRYGHLFDSPGRQFLEFLRAGALRMETLVGDLRNYTEASAIADAFHDSIDAAKPLEAALLNLQEAIRQSEACIKHDNLMPVRVKEVHLQQLFQNLIGNAIKYRGTRVPEINITSSNAGNYCLYSVRDNGIGIPQQHLQDIFGVFKRLHTNAEYAGTGMGLAICRRIVERYRGTIWAESTVGEGSTFSFKFPC